jgi:hypothetical protein
MATTQSIQNGGSQRLRNKNPNSPPRVLQIISCGSIRASRQEVLTAYHFKWFRLQITAFATSQLAT